ADPPATPAPAKPPADVVEDPAANRASAAALPPLAARLDDLVGRRDLAGAARTVLAANPAELKDDAVRERTFRLADSLVAAADAATDASATASRLDARRLYAALYACDASQTPEMTRAFDGCTRVNQALLFGNGAPDELVLRHKVAAGESVWSLA